MPSKVRRQKPLKGGRVPAAACVPPAVLRYIEREAARYNVSKSFVGATIFGKAMGYEDQEDYRGERQLRRVK